MLTMCAFVGRSQKFEDPVEGKEALEAKFSKVQEELLSSFRNLEDDYR